MTNEYIRKDDAVKECGDWYVEEGTEEGFIGTVSQMLDMFSPADVAPVVRCKDCLFFTTGKSCCRPEGLIKAREDAFCSYGERKEDNE